MIIDVVSYTVYKITNGFLDATCTIIGNLIGENNVELAWNNFKTILIFNFLFNILLSFVLLYESGPIASGFAPNQPTVSAIILEAFPMLLLACIASLGSVMGVIFALG